MKKLGEWPKNGQNRVPEKAGHKKILQKAVTFSRFAGLYYRGVI